MHRGGRTPCASFELLRRTFGTPTIRRYTDMRGTPAVAGGARGAWNQPKRTFIPPETVAPVSSAAISSLHVVRQPETLPRLRSGACLCGDLLQIRVFRDLGRHEDAGDDIAGRLVVVVAQSVRAVRADRKVHDLSLLELSLAFRRAKRRAA